MSEIKTLDTNEYLDTLCSIIEQDKGVSVVVTGSSMFPFLLSNKSWVYLKKPDTPVKRGDVALYLRDNTDYVLHRVYRVDGDSLYFVGDAQSYVDGPIPHSAVKAVVTRYKRTKKWRETSAFFWKFFSIIWLDMVKFREPLLRFYFSVRKFLSAVKKRICK